MIVGSVARTSLAAGDALQLAWDTLEQNMALGVAVETIRAFAGADLNVTRAAEEMRVHPNTIRYRLQQLATRTGHDPCTFA